jgi:hypothetical protein
VLRFWDWEEVPNDEDLNICLESGGNKLALANIKFVSQGRSAVRRLIYLERYEKKTTVGLVSKYNLKLYY